MPTYLFMYLNAPAFSTPAYSLNYFLYSAVFCFNIWFWVLALLGLSQRYLSFNNSFLKYFNRASYPIYMIHLVVMVVSGYIVVQWRTGIVAEFSILVTFSFVATIACYELAKRIKMTQFLFGVKWTSCKSVLDAKPCGVERSLQCSGSGDKGLEKWIFCKYHEEI